MATTKIGKSIIIEGEVSCEEDLEIEGKIKGKIKSTQGIFISPSGRVECDVETNVVEVSGKLYGNVSAREKTEVKSGGMMKGDIKAPRIVIMDGARFKGNIDMDVEE